MISTPTLRLVALAAACLAAGCTTPPPPDFGISVAITGQPNGPEICVSGKSFTPNGKAQIAYLNVPGAESEKDKATRGASGTAVASGAVTIKDTSQVFAGSRIQCSDEQKRKKVSVVVTDAASGHVATAEVPSGYWCQNDLSVPPFYNGGCN